MGCFFYYFLSLIGSFYLIFLILFYYYYYYIIIIIIIIIFMMIIIIICSVFNPFYKCMYCFISPYFLFFLFMPQVKDQLSHSLHLILAYFIFMTTIFRLIVFKFCDFVILL